MVVDAMSWQPPSVPPSGGYPPPPGYPQYPGVPGGAGATPWGPAPGLEYASFWRRFGGYILDGIIIAVPPTPPQ
jgi:hypothetical protein